MSCKFQNYIKNIPKLHKKLQPCYLINLRLVFSFVYFFILSICSAQNYEDIALHYAPIHIQNVCKKGKNSLQSKSDQLASCNFDGDWDATNNWENLETHDIKPVVYYSVVESPSHYFITYAYFHPRDWTRTPFTKIGQHENDLEGAVYFIKKDTTEFGKLEAIVTVFHNQLIYNAASKFEKYKIFEDEDKYFTIQQARGHGCKITKEIKIKEKALIYFPPDVTLHKRKFLNQTVTSCELINLFGPNELWSQRSNFLFFEKDQTIKGNNGKGANPPWLWQSTKWKKVLPAGAVAQYPSAVLRFIQTKKVHLDSNYIYNPYLGIE